MTNNNSNINSNILNTYSSSESHTGRMYNSIESQKMVDDPHNYLPDNQKQTASRFLNQMNMKDIYKNVKSFNSSNLKARKKWPGIGSRKSDINQRHFREGGHEMMIYNNGFRIVKFDNLPNVTFYENSKPKI